MARRPAAGDARQGDPQSHTGGRDDFRLTRFRPTSKAQEVFNPSPAVSKELEES
jgi:hypothetical protein